MESRVTNSRVVRVLSLFLYLQVFTSTVGIVAGFKLSSFRGKPASASLEFPNPDKLSNDNSRATIDLPLFIHTSPTEQNSFFAEALQLLNSMQHAPSCNQRAVASLVTSCQALSPGESERGQHAVSDLDHVKSLYAARLAICEVTGAGAAIPDKCSTIFPAGDNWKSKYKERTQDPQNTDEEMIQEPLLASCLRSLESKPQWWTSYSNSRQNAALMCHAVRFDIEKEELLNHHKRLTKVTSGLNGHLNRSLENAYTQAKQQHAFIQAIDGLRLKLLRDLRRDSASIHSRFTQLMTSATDMFQDANRELQGFVKPALTETAALSKQIQFSILSAREVKRVLNEVLIKGAKRNSDLIAAEQTALQTNAHLITDIHHSLEEAKKARIRFIAEDLNQLHVSMHSLSELVSNVTQRHTFLDDRVKHFNAVFSNFEQKASILQDMMIAQIMNQTRLQQSFHEDLRATQTLLQNITNAAIYLQATIGDAQSAFNTFSLWRGPLVSIVWWSWCAMISCIYAIFKMKLIVYVIFICVCAVVLLTSRAFGWLQAVEMPSPSILREATHADITCFALGFLFSAAAVTVMAIKEFPIKGKTAVNSNPDMIGLP
ncbi:hypothetical protein McanCB49686_002677 [Microsporum canis]